NARAAKKLRILGVLSCAWTLVFCAFAPFSFADDKPSQDDYENSLKTSYAQAFEGADVTDKQLSDFASCLSKATYSDLSTKTVTALTETNLDYEISSEETDLFLQAIDTCLTDTGLSELVVNTNSPNAENGNANSPANASKAKTADETPTYLLPLATGLTLLAIVTFAFYLLMRGRAREVEDVDD
ncbi:MAG: hypothetical protein IKZ87_07510, partial [Actinomycetaceae bacterium]|nr:hypothetical protein [Actinomycetaceae bacterium]